MTDTPIDRESVERRAHEAEYPHKRYWRLAEKFRPLLWAYGKVWEKQAGPVAERGGSPMEAMEEEVGEVERPILEAIVAIDIEADALCAALDAETARADRAEAEAEQWMLGARVMEQKLSRMAEDNERLRKALRRHHDWHLNQDRDALAWGIDPVDAYSESGLCEETVTALKETDHG